MLHVIYGDHGVLWHHAPASIGLKVAARENGVPHSVADAFVDIHSCLEVIVGDVPHRHRDGLVRLYEMKHKDFVWVQVE